MNNQKSFKLIFEVLPNFFPVAPILRGGTSLVGEEKERKKGKKEEKKRKNEEKKRKKEKHQDGSGDGREEEREAKEGISKGREEEAGIFCPCFSPDS